MNEKDEKDKDLTVEELNEKTREYLDTEKQAQDETERKIKERDEIMSNSANANITLPSLQMVHPNQVDAYMIVARDLLKSVEVLSTVKNVPPRGCALIAAYALECLLKAFLSHKGKNGKKGEKGFHKEMNLHNLIALWKIAYDEGTLKILELPPDWVTILSVGHGPDFYFRYQEGENKTVVNGGQTPALIPMAIELKALLEKVEISIKD